MRAKLTAAQRNRTARGYLPRISQSAASVPNKSTLATASQGTATVRRSSAIVRLMPRFGDKAPKVSQINPNGPPSWQVAQREFTLRQMTKRWLIPFLIAAWFGDKAFADCLPAPDTPASIIKYFKRYNKPLPEQFCAKEVVPQPSEELSQEPVQAEEAPSGPQSVRPRWTRSHSAVCPENFDYYASDGLCWSRGSQGTGARFVPPRWNRYGSAVCPEAYDYYKGRCWSRD